MEQLVAEDPEFTVAGTAYILGAAMQFGAFAGLALAARQGGWPRGRLLGARAVGIAAILPLGLGAGTLVLAIVIPVSLVVSRWRWWYLLKSAVGPLLWSGIARAGLDLAVVGLPAILLTILLMQGAVVLAVVVVSVLLLLALIQALRISPEPTDVSAG